MYELNHLKISPQRLHHFIYTQLKVLRCQYKGGRRNNLEGLSGTSTIADLQEKIWLMTDVPPHAQRILSGFPPKQLICQDKGSSLSSLDIRSGDTLIIEEDKKAPKVLLDGYKKSLSSAALGKITRSYVMLGDTSCTAELRKLIARCVSSDPQTYNNVFLGRANSDYCNWILDKENWGGAIELSILSKHYQTEIAVVDIESGRVDRFGEGSGYSSCVYLIYDGIHYDPLAVQSSDNSALPLQTVFPVDDDMRLAEALEIAADANQKRHFTNLSQFTIRCLVCGTPLTGQQAAQDHAISTGHTNFGEV
ncbi:ubiquitin thioesterase OTU1-like isoform X3 [Orbicella faveolata]|uniref:ubiquitin thioesterase OTU1-like isoform X3 n=1 Tax=Orbicella faveolata TaxID=48498 RepID=UPI0009E4943F|nr:ubiquitin thioesterase OTU1-like isoform X3 [Orbicella faveolata]